MFEVYTYIYIYICICISLYNAHFGVFKLEASFNL